MRGAADALAGRGRSTRPHPPPAIPALPHSPATSTRHSPPPPHTHTHTHGPPQVKEGDTVLYFKWAGDAMETPAGEKFVVLRDDDVLCKT